VDVPYWDVKVDPSIIKNHGDIWNPKAQAMMAAIFRMTNPLMNRASKVKPRAVLKKEPTRPKLVPGRLEKVFQISLQLGNQINHGHLSD
jgi:hypothetical protein